MQLKQMGTPKNYFKIIGSVVLVLILGFIGSATADMANDGGAKNPITEKINKIERGKTTQKEILTLFGEPQFKKQTVDGIVWTYVIDPVELDNRVDGDLTISFISDPIELNISFNKNMEVKDYDSHKMKFSDYNAVKFKTIINKQGIKETHQMWPDRLNK